MNIENLNKYWSALSEQDKVDAVKKAAQCVSANFKRKENAVSAEFNYNGDRKGVRGGKSTTLSARATSSTQIYFESVEYLKELTKRL